MKHIKYEFAIKKDVLNSGKEIFTPVVRIKRKFPFIDNKWERITKVYNTYMIWDLDFNPELTYEECVEHISEYQKLLQKQVENQVKIVEFHTLEEKTI